MPDKKTFFVAFSLLLSYLFSFASNTPPFIQQQHIFNKFKAQLNIRYDSYFLIDGLNTFKYPAIVFFKDDTNEIFALINGKFIKVNKNFLEKEGKNFVPLFRGVVYDGKYVYIYTTLKYGLPKYVVIFKINKENLHSEYLVIKEPSQALNIRLSADGKGNILVTWVDESKLPYRLVWIFSQDFLKSFSGPFVLSNKNISFFEPFINKSTPYILFVENRKFLKIKNLRSNDDKIIATLENPSDFKVKKEKKYIWIFIKEGGVLKIFALDRQTLKIKFNKIVSKISIRNKEDELKNYLWNLEDCDILHEKFTCSISAKPKAMHGVKLNGLTLPNRYNIFVLSPELNKFVWVNEPIPFLISNYFSKVDITNEKIFTVYFGRKFIYGNVFISTIGKNQSKDVALEPPNTETGLPKVLYLGGGVYRILYPVRQEDFTILKAVDINLKQLYKYYKFPPKNILFNELKKRISGFLKCQVSNDINCIMSYIDPISREAFKSVRRINIYIIDYRYEEIEIFEDTPFAVAKGIIKQRIPKGAFPGIKEDKINKVKTQDLWVYINNTWYFVPPAPIVGYFLKW